MKQLFDHPQLDSLELYILDRLGREETEETEEHLLVCDRCRVMTERLADQIALIKSTLASLEGPDDDPSTGRFKGFEPLVELRMAS